MLQMTLDRELGLWLSFTNIFVDEKFCNVYIKILPPKEKEKLEPPRFIDTNISSHTDS